MKILKTIYVHAEDPTTTFLSSLYKDDTNATVIRKGYTKQEVLQLIDSHDRVVFLGHGTRSGLINTYSAFKSTNFYIIDEEAIEILKKKSNSVFIWCYASEFQKHHKLSGFSCWNFISQDDELWAANLPQSDAKFINESNDSFVSILKDCIHLSNEEIYDHLKLEYGKVAINNPVAKYNCEHLYHYTSQ
jgi:hypothetical protein